MTVLKDDNLLVVDNFNAAASVDGFLDVMLRYRCRILFTTRCRYEEQANTSHCPATEVLRTSGLF